MKIRMINILGIFILTSITISSLFAQGKPYEGPDDPAGDIEAVREGYMTGNRILLYFQNTTELAKWTDTYRGSQWSRWPNTPDGGRMLDGIGLLIGARVYVDNDTIPVDDISIIQSRSDLDTLWFLQTSYRERMDFDPTGTVAWSLYPVYGYMNEFSEYPALSNLPESWPVGGWPSTNTSVKWPGEWNGRFGRGVIYADQETYFVANDAQDQEYLGPEDRVKYYPRRKYDGNGGIVEEVRIGDRRPQVTTQKGLPWGGVGVRVSQRGFQWNNPQARDAIFWEYSIANISNYTMPEVAFGYWVDNGIGGESDDELGYFDRQIDLAYSWDTDETGAGGLRTGTMGFAYLESPGIFDDFVDNDNDGLTDEKRDNEATMIIGPTDGITNLPQFLETYGLELEDLVDHWDADEDQDWQNGLDLNGNGRYSMEISPGVWVTEPGEEAGDDVGLDGVGPTELNYTGPDEGEGNGKPDYQQGVGCEPNFNATDVTESDMVGLTAFRLFPIPPHTPPYTNWFQNDKSMWQLIGTDSTLEYLGNISNLVECFASGTFPLFQGSEERISMSEVHSYDALAGLMSDAHSAPALYEAKRIVQVIYEKDYRFAQPPKMPTLSATAGDGKVILTWDNLSDTKTRDPFLGNINDFEGYKIFRASDKYMSDAEVITDGFGDPKLKKPIFQVDRKNDITGFTDFGLVNGAAYNLGYDSGLTHHFIDETVDNGRTYYYGIVAYDFGAASEGSVLAGKIPVLDPGISPSENNVVIDLEEGTEIVRSTGKNVAIVTPHAMAAGYIAPSIEGDEELNAQVLGSGQIEPEVLSSSSLKNGHTYKVTFQLDTIHTVTDYDHGLLYTNAGLTVWDATDNYTPVYQESPENFAYDNLSYDDTTETWSFKSSFDISSDVFDGLRLNMFYPVKTAQFDRNNSGWVVGSAPIRITQTVTESQYFPWDYEIIYTNNDSAYVSVVSSKTMRDENGLRIDRSKLLVQEAFSFYVINKSFTDSSGAYEKLDLVVEDMNRNLQFDILEDRVLAGPITKTGRWAGTAFIIDFMSAPDSNALPENNDVYQLTYTRPFWAEDTLTFTVDSETGVNETELKMTMDDIKVVPNPYVATNEMEEGVSNPFLNQRRNIMFTHIPAKCVIKIFTSNGYLIDEIEVNNSSDNGSAHWDLLTKEGLEIAAGVYIYHIRSHQTGDEKLGKFAVVK